MDFCGRGWTAPAAGVAAVLLLAGAPTYPPRCMIMRRWSARSIRSRRSVSAVPRNLDGVLDDEAWQRALVIDEFTQQEPSNGAAGHRTHRSAGALRRRAPLYRRARVRFRAVQRDRHRDAPRFGAACSTRTTSRSSSILSAIRGRATCSSPTRSAPSSSSRCSKKAAATPAAPSSNINRDWNGVWESAARRDQRRLDRRDSHPDGDAAVARSRGPDLGHQLHAQHPPQERAGVLGADSEAVRNHPGQPGRHGHRDDRPEPRHGPAHQAVPDRRRPPRPHRIGGGATTACATPVST